MFEFELMGSRGVVSGGLFYTAALLNGLTSSVRAAGRAKAELILRYLQNARESWPGLTAALHRSSGWMMVGKPGDCLRQGFSVLLAVLECTL